MHELGKRFTAAAMSAVLALSLGLGSPSAWGTSTSVDAPSSSLAATDVDLDAQSDQESITTTAERLGIGGGGALFDPAVSPHDSNEIATGTDMGDLYISHDGGATWSKKTVGQTYDITYDPTDSNRVYAGGSGIWRSTDRGDAFELLWPKASRVMGEPKKYESFRYYLFNSDGYDAYSQVKSIAIDPADNKRIYALLAPYEDGWEIWRSVDDGATFAKIGEHAQNRIGVPSAWEDNSKLVVHDGHARFITQAGIYDYDGSGSETVVYEPTGDYRCILDCDQVFSDGTDGFAAGAYYWITEGVEDLATTTNPKASLRRTRDFATFDDFAGDMGNQAKWFKDTTKTTPTDPVLIDMRIHELAAASPARVYFRVFTKIDGQGSTEFDELGRYDASEAAYPFRWVFGQKFDQNNAPYRSDLLNGSHADGYLKMWGIATSPKAPTSFVLDTGFGVYRSTDCEERQTGTSKRSSVRQLYSNVHSNAAVATTKASYSSTGIDNVTTYGIRIDPFNDNHVAVLNTDFGLTISNDAGKTWARYNATGDHSVRPAEGVLPDAWTNTVYDLEFDPYIKGRVYALWSGRHDAPYESNPSKDKASWRGGFAQSDMSDSDWESLVVKWDYQSDGSALPAESIPVSLDVVYPQGATAQTPEGARTIWVACFNKGFYRSTDSGATFEAVNDGLPATGGLIYGADVEASADGSRVFACTARRTDNEQAGKVYQLNAAGNAWEEVALPEGCECPRDIEWDDENATLYISCAAGNKWKSNGGDSSQSNFYNYGGGLYSWKPGEALAHAADAESGIVGTASLVEGAAVDGAGNLFASDSRGNVYVRRFGQSGFEKIYEKFHVGGKGVQLVAESVADGTRTDTLSLPSFGGGQLKLTVTLAEQGEDSPDDDEYACVADMVADTALKAGDVAVTSAYYRGGANGNSAAGAGTYDIVDATASGFTFANYHTNNGTGGVDGGRYVQLENGLVAVLRLENRTVDLYQYGCKGDGTTDDAERIQLALNSAARTVHVSPGRYAMTAGVSAYSYTDVVGENRETCQFIARRASGGSATTSDAALFDLPGEAGYSATNMALRRIGIDGGSGGSAGSAGSAGSGTFDLITCLHGATNVTLEDCLLENGTQAALRVAGVSGVDLKSNAVKNVNGGFIVQGDGSKAAVDDLEICGNSFAGCSGQGAIVVEPTNTTCNHVRIEDNSMENLEEACAIRLASPREGDDYATASASDATFRNVTIRNTTMNGGGGIVLARVGDTYEESVTTRDVAAREVDSRVEKTTATGVNRALELYRCAHVSVADLSANSAPGIALDALDASSCTFSGITVDGLPEGADATDNVAIRLRGNGAGTKVAGRITGLDADAPTSSWLLVTGSGYDVSGMVPSTAQQGDAQREVVEPADIDDVLINPGKGWLAFGPALEKGHYESSYTDWTDGETSYLDKIGCAYWRWNWSTIEPSEGEYRWDIIDDAIEYFDQQGKKLSFGIMSANTSSTEEYVTPKWVFDKGAQYDRFEGTEDSSGQTRWQYYPKWTDPTYLECVNNFTKALAERYDNDPRVAFVGIRSYGNWGEQHLYGINPRADYQYQLENNITSEQLRELYIKPFLDAFKNTLLYNAWGLPEYDDTYEWAVERGATLRRDGIYNISDGHELEIDEGKLPAIFEWGGSYWTWKTQDDWKGTDDFQRRLTSYVDIGKPSYMLLDLDMYRENPSYCDWLANRVGYWLRIKQASWPKTMVAGQSAEVSMRIANDGVAPLFEPATGCFVLLDQDGHVVARCETDWDAGDWRAGIVNSETATVSFGDAAAGTYTLAFGLLAASGNEHPTYQLGSEGRTADNWYTLGNITLTAHQSEDPTPTDETPADTGNDTDTTNDDADKDADTNIDKDTNDTDTDTDTGNTDKDAAGTIDGDIDKGTDDTDSNTGKGDNDTDTANDSVDKDADAADDDSTDKGTIDGSTNKDTDTANDNDNTDAGNASSDSSASNDEANKDANDANENGNDAAGSNSSSDAGANVDNKSDVSADSTPGAKDGEHTDAVSDNANNTSATATASSAAVVSAPASTLARPVYALRHRKTGSWDYETSPSKASALARAKWLYRGVAFYAPSKGGIKVYVLKNKKTGARYYTTSSKKAKSFAAKRWKRSTAPFQAAASGTAIYRMYHKKTHVYQLVKGKAKVTSLKKRGWKPKGVACYCVR